MALFPGATDWCIRGNRPPHDGAGFQPHANAWVFRPKILMKLRLGSKVIQLCEVQRVRRVGRRTAQIQFFSGKSIKVTCGMNFPDGGIICFPGSLEDLIGLIHRCK